MAKNVPRRINTLSGFLRWAEQFNNGQYLFRGVPDKKYKIEASACRRLPDADRNNPVKLLKINQELIEKARLLGHDHLNGQRLSDLELLAELQHFRAATCLIDFTRNAFVGLWFACEQISTTGEKDEVKETDDNVKETHGKVYAVRIDDPARFRTITSESLGEDIDSFFNEDENGRYPLYQWQPKRQNNRIIAQQSVFIFGGAKIEAEDECIVEGRNKKNIMRALDKLSGITEATIYPDSDGFARLHVHNNPDFEPDPPGYLQRGIEVHQKGEREEAITYYTTVISPSPDNTLHPPDNNILSWAYNHRGTAYFSEDPSESAVNLAIEDFTEAILLKTKALDSTSEDPTKVIQLKKDLARTYVHRGVARYWKKGDFDLAVTDYTNAIELDPGFADAYNHRGIAYLSNGDFDLAIADYTEVTELDPDLVDAYKDLGIAHFSKGNFNQAIAEYIKAIQKDPEDTSTYNYRGLTYFKNGEINEAIDDFSRAIQLNPNDANAYYNRSIVWLSSQNWEKAKADLTTAIANELNVVVEFQQDYESVEDFERKTDIKLPEDIVEILS